MRVLQFLSSSAFHGAEVMTAELTRQLHASGVSVEVAILDNNGRGNAEIFEAVGSAAGATYRIPCGGQIDLATLRRLNRIVKDRKIDVIHSHKYKTSFYSALTHTVRPVKVLTTYHNWLYQTRALRVYATVDKQLARFSDLCVGVSTPVTDELRRYVPSRKVLQIDNGIDVSVYHPGASRAEARAALGLSPQRPLAGFVGRLSVEKGLPYFIEAVAGLLEQDFDVVIVGDGELRGEIEAKVASLGLSQRVSLWGNRRDTPQIYRALDLFVLPSTQEAFPMVALEAMASGCAIVATAVGEVSRILDNGNCGLVVPPADVIALRDAMGGLLDNEARRRHLGQLARERVVANYSSQAMAAGYLHAYEHILASPAALTQQR